MLASPHAAARALRFTALGGVVLVAIVRGRAAGIPALVLMLGPGVAVPLGLAIALGGLAPRHEEATSLPRRAITFVAPIGAAAGVLGWLAPPGHPAAIGAAALHGVVCALGGMLGLSRVYARARKPTPANANASASTSANAIHRFGPLHEIAIDVGLLLLPVAGVWFFASRAAMPLIGFEEPVVTFTAAHFHFAGFAAPTIIGGVGRLLFDDEMPKRTGKSTAGWRRLYRIAATAVCAGVPLTAIGIATNHTIESIAAVTLASGMLCASVVLVFAASRRAAASSIAAAVLFVVSGATLLLTMSLAATFALTSSAGRGSSLHGAVALQTMIDWHGGANAIGFSLAGLLALTLVSLRSKRDEDVV